MSSDDKQTLAEDRTDWAEDRTDWAEDRTLMANERTFLSWMGSVLGCLGMAVAMQAVFGEFEPTWLARACASIFVLLALMMVFTALRRTHKAHVRLQSHAHEPASIKLLHAVAYGMAFGACAVGAILWVV